MTLDDINLGEILFGATYTSAVNKAKAEVEAKVEAKVEIELEKERVKTKKQQLFLQLRNLLNLIKRLPNLQDKDIAAILEGTTATLVKKTRLALGQKKRVDIKKQLTTLHFKKMKLDAKDQKKVSKILTDYFKKETTA